MSPVIIAWTMLVIVVLLVWLAIYNPDTGRKH